MNAGDALDDDGVRVVALASAARLVAERVGDGLAALLARVADVEPVRGI